MAYLHDPRTELVYEAKETPPQPLLRVVVSAETPCIGPCQECIKRARNKRKRETPELGPVFPRHDLWPLRDAESLSCGGDTLTTQCRVQRTGPADPYRNETNTCRPRARALPLPQAPKQEGAWRGSSSFSVLASKEHLHGFSTSTASCRRRRRHMWCTVL